MPEGCKCDPDSWDHDPEPICRHFEDSGLVGSHCLNCSHDHDCH